MPADNYSDVVQALAKQIVDTCMRTLHQNFQGMIRGVSIDADQIQGEVRNVSSTNLHINAANVSGLNAYVADMIEHSTLDISQIATADEEGNLHLNNVFINSAQISDLTARYAELWEAHIGKAEIQTALIDVLKSNFAAIADAQIQTATIDTAQITNLETEIANIAVAKIGEADIDFAHIKDLTAGTAIIERGVSGKLYIADLAVTEANIVDLTVGQLVVKGEDGGYYQITVTTDEEGNTHVGATERMQIGNDEIGDLSINADEKIIEGSITAKTLNVQDIFASNAVIMDLIAKNINTETLFANSAFIQHLNTADISGNQSLKLAVDGARDDIMEEVSIRLSDDSIISTVTQSDDFKNQVKDAAAPVLKIDSSRGTVFKNNSVNTALTVTVYRGNDTITNQTQLTEAYGDTAYLKWQALTYADEASGRWRDVPASDSRISNDGFTLTLTPEDVDTKVTFRCLLEQDSTT